MSCPTIYLVANNMSPSQNLQEYVSRLRVNDNDIVVVFNQGGSPLVKKLPKIDIACFRYNGGGTSSFYFGVKNDLNIMSAVSKADRFFFLNDPGEKHTSKIIAKNKIEDRYEVHGYGPSLKYDNIEYIYGKSRAPTTGMFYLFYFLNNYPDYNLQLLGFDLGNRKDDLHPYSKERKIIKTLSKLDRVNIVI
jgi:hypothetical protein